MRKKVFLRRVPQENPGQSSVYFEVRLRRKGGPVIGHIERWMRNRGAGGPKWLALLPAGRGPNSVQCGNKAEAVRCIVAHNKRATA